MELYIESHVFMNTVRDHNLRAYNYTLFPDTLFPDTFYISVYIVGRANAIYLCLQMAAACEAGTIVPIRGTCLQVANEYNIWQARE